jgi:hypothetical protein
LRDVQITISDAPIPRTYHSGKGGARMPENRRFIAWDGEGVTPKDSKQQNYVLFGNSTGAFIAADSLTTQECFDIMHDARVENPNAIHVGFAFMYDVEMILRDVPHQMMWILHKYGVVKWNGYRIELRKKKWLIVTRMSDKVSIKIWDIFTFFGTSFVVAVKEYVGDSEDLEFVKAGKMLRNDFSMDTFHETILPYWQKEIAMLETLADKLRENLYGAGIRISAWHGPGAIASYGLKLHKIDDHMAVAPDEVNVAAQYAYSGGRFELFKIGRANMPVFAYDIRSAYPAAIATLPSLANGEWNYVESPTKIAKFGVYRIEFHTPQMFTRAPMPLFYRDSHAAIHYPIQVTGWYWSPEAKMAKATGATIIGGWEFTPATDTKPFAFVNDIYRQRAEWKREGNPSQMALKLFLNSLYGKTAQRVGGGIDTAPKWHQLEWAGYVTSFTRAKMFRAMVQAHSKDALIGVETDGIFSTEPLDLDIGPNLGQWEADTYDDIVYLQSGFYWKKDGDNWIQKCRGFDRDSLSVESALQILDQEPDNILGSILGKSTRFSTMGQWLRLKDREEYRCRWETSLRVLKLGTDGKRVHRAMACRACAKGIPASQGMHDMTIAQHIGGESFPHDLPWVTTNDIGVNPHREIIEMTGISY